MECELYFAFDVAVLFVGAALGFWIRSICGRDHSVKELLEYEEED